MDITELLEFSAQQGASDLHLSAGLPPMIRVKVAQMYSAMQTGQAIGMQTMDQCLQGLVESASSRWTRPAKKRGSPTALRSDTYYSLSQVVNMMAAASSSIGLAAKSPSWPDASAAALASRLESRSSTSVTIR